MQWGLKRQFLYALAILTAVGLVLAGAWFAYFYHPATCADGIQNQDELGIDCGGVCKKLCTAPRVSALWARAVEVAPGVYHAVAMVQNPETDAGTLYLPYKFSLYDAGNILIAERTGLMQLFPGDVVPLFEPNIVTGSRTPTRTLVDFGQAVWSTMSPMQNPIRVDSATPPDAIQNTLRLSATVENTSALLIPHAVVTALLYDASGTLIAASQTTLSDLAARTTKDIVFTWQEPFSAAIVKVDIVPRLPAQAGRQ